MTILLILGKVIASFFLVGLAIGGLTKLSPAHRNPDASPVVEHLVGAMGLGLGLYGFYYLWFS